METLFKTLFPEVPRQADRADAHLGMNRQGAGQQRGGKSDAGPEDDESAGENADSAVLSVEAVSVFLQARLMADETDPAPVSAAAPAAADDEQRSVSPAMAAAAHAYAQAAKAVPAPPGAHALPAVPAVPVAEEDHRREVGALLEDLEALSRAGVQDLTIRRESTFLGSIGAAVAAARAALTEGASVTVRSEQR